MSADAVIHTRALSKHFGPVIAVQDLSIEICRGEIYSFLGRNGAGKTTTIRMVLGLVRPTHGAVEILGRRIKPGETEVFRRVGYLVESAAAYPNLTVCENLELQRRLMAAPAAAVGNVIARLGLDAYAARRAGRLSSGNLQRLALARALLHNPEILILDEPASALDPAGVVEIRELLRELCVRQGVAVFMSSHNLSEVAHLADRIGIVHEGRLVEEFSPEEMRVRERPFVEMTVSDPARALTVLWQAGIREVEQRGGSLRAYDARGREAEIARLLVHAGIDVTLLRPSSEDLESYFLRRTGGQ